MIASVFRRLAQRLRSLLRRNAGRASRDQRIARRLRDAFEEDLAAADVRGLHFYAQNGTVTIYGTVRHGLDRDLLRSIAEEVPGVEKVEVHLQVAEAE